jgi:hypothetical protein
MTFLHWPRFFDASRRDMQVIARRGPERQKILFAAQQGF